MIRRLLLAVLLAGSMTLGGTSGCSNPNEPECLGYGEVCTVNGHCCTGYCKGADCSSWGDPCPSGTCGLGTD